MSVSTSSQHYYLLFMGVALPFLLRSLESMLGTKLMDCVCTCVYGKGDPP